MIEDIDQKILARFEIIQKIRKTNSAIIWKAIDRKEEKVVAIKKVNPKAISAAQLLKKLRDTLILLDLNTHNSIIKLHQVIKSEEWYFVYEFVEMDLQTLIRVQILSDLHQQIILYNITKALYRLELSGILHCDLSPSKILVDPECNIKIIGFGFAQDFLSYEENGNFFNFFLFLLAAPLNEFSKMRFYKAPEILLGATHYTMKVDVWSLGCILGEMITSDVLFEGNSTLSQLEKIIELVGKPKENLEEIGSDMASNILSVIQAIKKKVRKESYLN